MNFNASQSMKDNLAQAGQEKAGVTLHLRNGMSLSGRVGDVGDHVVVLANLTGKEFYDALVTISDISAVEARADELIPVGAIMVSTSQGLW